MQSNQITGICITNPGSGYTTAPSIMFGIIGSNPIEDWLIQQNERPLYFLVNRKHERYQEMLDWIKPASFGLAKILYNVNDNCDGYLFKDKSSAMQFKLVWY